MFQLYIFLAMYIWGVWLDRGGGVILVSFRLSVFAGYYWIK